MKMNDDACYRALTARDARFDGVFFIGVTSTGIYCRPICPARPPRRENCRFFTHAAAAERAGFRPCLRCRPELAPGQAPVDAVGRTARLAAARIEAGALNGAGGLETLAKEFGLSSRQLRRVVRKELGASPVELAQTARLLLAKRLLAESHLPVIRVAFASGFESVRRFNALFRSHYGLTPTRVRRAAPAALSRDCLRLTLAYRPPFAWRPLLRFLASRATAGVEAVADNSYLRTVHAAGRSGWLTVKPVPGRNALAVELAASLTQALPLVLGRLRDLFDLNARPDVIAAHLSADPRLAPLVARRPGLRAPGAFDGFELAVRAVLGQRISVKAATTLAGRLAAAFGEPVETPFPALNRLIPSAERLAAAGESALGALGITAARAACLVSLARAVVAKRIVLEPGPDPETVVGKLQEYPGIGEWTAQYIALRALRWPDAFPAGDLGLLKAAGAASPRALRTASAAWRPWRAYAAMHLWESLHYEQDNDDL
jgi:AraC family transcriptional regulator, regulatory protein of adaptative response / DNA-3-methyladenine glycosylase II